MKNKEEQTAPKLRFKGYTDAWQQRLPKEFLIESKIIGHKGNKAKKLTVKLWGKGIVKKSVTTIGSNKTQYYIRRKGQLMYGKLDFLHAAFGIVPAYLDGYESTIDSPSFDIKNADANFLLNIFLRKNFYLYYGEQANGSRKAKRIHQKDFLKMAITVPSYQEQNKISLILKKVDYTLTLLQRKLDNLKNANKGIYQAIFNPQRDIKEGWKKVKFKDIFDYERPDKYIVSSDQYVTKGTPVLTANKSFILGYTRENNIYDKGNVILFDDFTLEKKFVNFKFMVKSSALKILTNKPNYDLYFSYKLLLFTHLLKEGHSRHYISTVQNTNVYVPSYKVQKYYSNLFDKMDSQEKILDKKISELIKIKQFLLQNMFI